MKVFRWALAGAGGLVVAGLIAFAAMGSGLTQAQQPEKQEAYNQALADQLGISVDELKAAREAALDQVLDAAVAAGRITPEQAEQIKENPRDARGNFAKQAGAKLRTAIGDLIGVAASTIGISTDELKEGIKSGQSIAQIADANGSSAAEVKAALTAEIDSKLAAAVAEGKINQEQAERIGTAAKDRLDQFINNTGEDRPNVEKMGPRVRP